jgi:hypothetical protein
MCIFLDCLISFGAGIWAILQMINNFVESDERALDRLAKVERFFYEISKIPLLQSRLECFQSVQQLPGRVAAISQVPFHNNDADMQYSCNNRHLPTKSLHFTVFWGIFFFAGFKGHLGVHGSVPEKSGIQASVGSCVGHWKRP